MKFENLKPLLIYAVYGKLSQNLLMILGSHHLKHDELLMKNKNKTKENSYFGIDFVLNL